MPRYLPRVSAAPRPTRPSVEDRNDLGFGSVVAAETRHRLLNRDGTFNVRRRGLGWFKSQGAYHMALNLTWPRFLAACVGAYLVLNVVFALAFLACGEQALVGVAPLELGGPFWRAFFFSVETFATIGYGNIAPVGPVPHTIMVVESLAGLMAQALITGLLFARFARPTAAIRFSRQMVVAPFKGGLGLMFRIVNTRENQIIDLKARVNCAWMDQTPAGPVRRFQMLDLERTDVMLFPLAWTIVHPIDEKSPLYGLTEAQLRACAYEFIALITGTDETFAAQVHARTSYLSEEVAWGAKFRNIFNPPDGDGILSVDVDRLDEFDLVPLPGPGGVV